MKPLRLFLISCIFVISACQGSNQAANQMHVNVVDGQGRGIADAAVVMGTRDGAVASFASTDGLGEAYFDSAPPNATVTAAFSCYSPSADRTYYSVDIAYEVNVSAITLTVGTCDQENRQVNINVTDTLAGITSSDVTIGPITYGGSGATMDVQGSLQDDGNISVFATGYDDTGAILGYGFALDQPVVDGSTIDIVIDRTDLVQHTHRFDHVPFDAVSYYAFASLLRKHAATNLPFNFAGDMAPIPASITTYSTGSFSDDNMLGATVRLDQDGDGNDDAGVGFIRYLSNPSDQLFDFGSAPAVPGALTYDPGANGRPIITWSNRDPLSTVQTLVLSYRTTTPQRASFYCSMTVPASAAGLVYPELPDMLANFRPTAYSNLSLQTIKFVGPVGYNDYLEATADFNGRFYEAAGLNSYSYASISRLP